MADAPQPNPAVTPTAAKSMDEIMALCKRRGFVFQASEIYGGINGFWDYGPLGAQLKKNLRDAWWQDVVLTPPVGPTIAGADAKPRASEPVEMVGLDTCIIQHPKVWAASGHIAGFNDPMVDCKKCKSRFRADHLWVLEYSNPTEWDEWASNTASESKLSAEAAAAWQRLTHHRESLSKSERKDLNDLVNLDELKSVTEPRRFHKSVVAGSAGEAEHLLELSAKERKELKHLGFELFNIYGIDDEMLDMDMTPCPKCGAAGSLTEPRQFNLMFKTYIGATATEDDIAYLRPETAQGIFVNFKNVVDTSRVRVPFGIAQTGKAFRNEVTPRNFTFRSREFEQMEIEFFCHPSEAKAWYAFWRDWRMAWWRSLGLASDNLQLREHDRDELAHYAKEGAGTSDIEYRFPFTAPGFGELEGVAHRSDFDLRQHQEHSKVKLDYFDTERGPINPKSGQPTGERYLPHVIEPSAGLDRGVLALLCEAYTPDASRPSGVYMKFHPRIAPIKAAVFPLVNKDGMPEKAEPLHRALRKRFGVVEYDAKQTIGKRYARMDEAGCPFCFTIDGQTMTDDTVTIRHRDTQQQERMAIGAVPDWLGTQLGVAG